MRQFIAVLAILWAGMAQASQVTILSINSYWEVDTLPVGNANVTGNLSNEIYWGRNFTSANGPRSGFKFEQTVVGDGFQSTHDANKTFDVGVFTHMNRVIFQNEHLNTARLTMTVTASFDGMVREFTTSYRFSLWETPNLDEPCANGATNRIGVNQSGCADRVELLKNDALVESFTDENGLTYQFELLGFDSGAEFWTIEDKNNTSWLKARFNVTGGPTVSPVPLPAGAWLLLGGLGGLALLRRRKARG